MWKSVTFIAYFILIAAAKLISKDFVSQIQMSSILFIPTKYSELDIFQKLSRQILLFYILPGCTPLHVAAHHGNIKVANYLLSLDAKVNAKTKVRYKNH